MERLASACMRGRGLTFFVDNELHVVHHNVFALLGLDVSVQ